MARMRTLECAYCGREFKAERKPGPPLRYCKPAHRQRAYEERRRAASNVARSAERDEIQELRARVRRLEHDNRRLREELTETTEETIRLRHELDPPPPEIAYLTGRAGQQPPATPTEKRRRRRRQA
jgi:hypothetical protein